MRKILFGLSILLVGYACTHPAPVQPVANWQNLDLATDGVFGISTEKAYRALLKGKSGVDVVVAVLDSGIDTAHEDLRSVLWTDTADGSHGRNFVGPEMGREDLVSRLETFINRLRISDTVLRLMERNIGKVRPSFQDFRNYHARDERQAMVLDFVMHCDTLYPDYETMRYAELDRPLDLAEYHLAHGLNRIIESEGDTALSSSAGKSDGRASEPLPGRGNFLSWSARIIPDPLGLVADPNVAPWHGTHMAGIIAATRNNGIGINGIADHAKILTVKLDDNIREMRNVELAAGIRYAVDHGARVISMSFGKGFSLHRALVDSAVKYAMGKDVLIVHSSGNDGMDIDRNAFYPSPFYEDGGVAASWLTVGASGLLDDTTLAAGFSNLAG